MGRKLCVGNLPYQTSEPNSQNSSAAGAVEMRGSCDGDRPRGSGSSRWPPMTGAEGHHGLTVPTRVGTLVVNEARPKPMGWAAAVASFDQGGRAGGGGGGGRSRREYVVDGLAHAARQISRQARFSNAGPGLRRLDPPSNRTRSFCVQKHLASDASLRSSPRADGVLLYRPSQGPSLDPPFGASPCRSRTIRSIRRVRVIPGYGAGIVLLWDHVLGARSRGRLGGGRDRSPRWLQAQGLLVLVRPRPGMERRRRRRSWLLIKHRDEWSGAVDITAFAPRRQSGGDFENIVAARAPALWRSAAPPQTSDRRPGGHASQRILDKAAARAAAT